MNYELIFIFIQKRYFKKSSELIDYFAQIHLESASSLPCCIIIDGLQKYTEQDESEKVRIQKIFYITKRFY